MLLFRTDELIQGAIREKFKECTVLTIAHRLRTVIDSDRIMVRKYKIISGVYMYLLLQVLDNGRVLEFDTPPVLLSNKHSQFSSLVKETGLAEAKHLRMLANDAKLNAHQEEEMNIYDEEVLEDDSESDPLISSVISI